MSDIAIKIENLGKLYRLGEVGTGTISHDLNRWIAKIRRKEDPFSKIGESNDRTSKGSSEYVWALKDVNFEVKKGEVLGIIGRNGAGKSTLLKLLSKVTQPSTGQIKVNGRIASLLEVGTGFHPEMTGRENVFLNGAIMGMTKSEIKQKFDEIVDFAGVERYVDTPVKRYSSGMYVRLAFAVAAHLEPEILIVDEVLAVGDAEFQKKCLGKMKDVSVNEGRTVLFVSHNMGAVANLCSHGVLMHNGGLLFDGAMDVTIDKYLNNSFLSTDCQYIAPNLNMNIMVVSAKLKDGNGNISSVFSNNKDINIELIIQNKEQARGIRCIVAIFDMMENLICVERKILEKTNDERLMYNITVPPGKLVANSLKVSVALDIPGAQLIEIMPDNLYFTVEDVGSEVVQFGDTQNGLVFLDMKWKLLKND